jgi:hypothetical protein
MSIIKTQKWSTNTGVLKNSVIQTVSSVKTNTTYINSTTWVETGLSCSINLTQETTNKVLVQYLLNAGGAFGHSSFRLMRDRNDGGEGVPLCFGDSSGSRTSCTHQIWAASGSSPDQRGLGFSILSLNNSYVDSPGIGHWRYYIVASSPYSSSYYCGINYHPYDDSNDTWVGRVASLMTLMEIQA